MSKAVKEIFNLTREKEMNATIDLLRGDGCNDTAKGYLLGLRDAYNDILTILLRDYIKDKKKASH